MNKIGNKQQKNFLKNIFLNNLEKQSKKINLKKKSICSQHKHTKNVVKI